LENRIEKICIFICYLSFSITNYHIKRLFFQLNIASTSSLGEQVMGELGVVGQEAMEEIFIVHEINDTHSLSDGVH